MACPVIIYRPVHTYQLISSDPYGKFNCTAASFKMLVDASSLGATKITTAQVRAMSSEPIPNPSSPGLNIPQMVGVASILHIEFEDRTDGTWSDVIEALGEDRRVLAQLKNEELHDGTTSNVPHAILLQAVRVRGILGNNPLLHSSFWYDPKNVRRAMEELAEGTKLYFGVSRRNIPRLPA